MNWQLVTFFGDSTVLLPSAAVLFIVLFQRKDSTQVAWRWALLFGITGTIVCASKLAFMGWGIGIRELDFTGFSGHSALATAFWPVLLWLLCARAAPTLRFASIMLGYALAGLVGYSRLMVHAHSTSEVITGFLLGAAGSALFLLMQSRVNGTHTVQLSWGGLASVVIIPILLLNTGAKAPTQSLLSEVAVKLGPLEKPFTRADLHKRFY
ncbi:TPA: phosphatase PAP2 family protein [Klebsiella quasipneumoniae subsp. similipneumoniae]|uniref:Acid phosphatase n=1 Tax=Klebsiella pneumoniae TaxID=573 RepID=A0A5P2YB16_KLEPN|nr:MULTISPECIES: phosphatase PAP2 family protein [Klebsiella]MBC4460599.1 phosphatase PAP2 family protein [Klebsiella pneumoniae]MBC4775326.1 phosphatase PAP2 family protein [Klebsiella pneumoniae]MBQ5006577.1 phosphatase PAP2 family protein [Klebsiella pneumoniae]MCP5887468.1 phosphatase PAP2 family protein [Klebsiella pneumoniae]MCW9429165.1 phosphatase PAP2 family protein [Klebsiella pneumoniae]